MRLRLFGVAALVAGAVVACARGPHPRTTPTPRAPRDTTVAARTDTSARRDSAARAARADSIARDSAARAARAADSAQRAAGRPRRRNTEDPTSRCRFVAINETPDSPPNARLQNYTDGQGHTIVYVGGGVVARCRGINNRLQADSAEYYEVNGMLLLVNNVVYDEPTRVHLTSNRLTYFTADERLLAEGNVVVTLPTGTTMTGPQAEYLREAPAIRDRPRLNATGRPVLKVVTSSDSGASATTTSPSRAPARRGPTTTDTATVIANTILDEGDSLVYASGQVQIIRPDVIATSDSATFDQGTELAHLVNNAQIKGQRGRSFTLSGTLIDLYSKQRELTRVLSRGKAHVVSDELDLKSDTVDLRVRDSRVERAYAWGPSRATATSPERDVVADSIEAIMPDQRIRELHALRRAVARSAPDSTKIASKERDFLSGDTIVARFDTLAAARDTTRNPPVKQIVAAGNASSLYQIASSQAQGRDSQPGINYVRGRRITVDFDSSQVQTVTVTDSATGVYLERGDSTDDSTRARRNGNPTPSRAGRGGAAPGGIRRPGGRPTGDTDETAAILAPAAAERPRHAFVRGES